MRRSTIVTAIRRQTGGRHARIRAGAVALLGLAALLGGCTGTAHMVPVADAGALPPSSALSADPGTAGAAPAGTATDATAATAQQTTSVAALPGDTASPVDAAAALEAAEAETFASAEPADPGAVMGLAPTDVEALLGAPGLVRHEDPAEVWQYQSRGCVLDVFLYREAADFEVVYLEARDGRAVSAATAICLGSVMDERRETPMS